MVKEIVTDPIILKIKSTPATEADLQTVQDLKDTLKANSERCVGMAANMIGVHKNILAAYIGKDILVMINPEITDRGGKTYESEEGCLSLTGVRKTTRSSVITVEYLDEKFRKKKRTLRNFEACIIQHEIDHFSGILI